MYDEDEASDLEVMQSKTEAPKRRRSKRVIIPHRDPSMMIPEPKVLVMTAGIKPKPVKLRQCLVSPLSLYELCAAIVDKLAYPDPFEWNEEQVANWMEEVVGLPQYKECIIDNHINGRRLLRLEDPSVLPEINIRDFIHIKKITAEIRKLFMTSFVLFARSIGLPIRKPLTHCTWFKSRTGPSWGIRQNWTRSDILRWMKIIMPKPIYLDHWDLVWYQKPDWPKVLLARRPRSKTRDDLTRIPRYEPPKEERCYEYTTPRRFRLQPNKPDEIQAIWMEHQPGSPSRIESEKKEKEEEKERKRKIKSKVYLKYPSLAGLAGKDLVLARRKMAKPKFLP